MKEQKNLETAVTLGLAGGRAGRRRLEEKIGNSRVRALTGISRDTKVKAGTGTAYQ